MPEFSQNLEIRDKIANDSIPHARGNTANQAGSSFSPMKPPFTISQQIARLRDRGLRVNNEAAAAKHLSEANYYRLRGYWMTLEVDDSFIEEATFDDIWDIYQLDCGLRQWLASTIEPVEIKLRAQFAYELSLRYGPRAYLDDGNFKNLQAYKETLKSYGRELEKARRSSVPCVVHNLDKYGDLPLWAAVEVMSMGNVSSPYGNLGNKDDAKAIAKVFG